MTIKHKEFIVYPLNYDYNIHKYKVFYSKYQAFKYAVKIGGGDIMERIYSKDSFCKTMSTGREWEISPAA